MVNDRDAIYTGHGETAMDTMLYVSAFGGFFSTSQIVDCVNSFKLSLRGHLSFIYFAAKHQHLVAVKR